MRGSMQALTPAEAQAVATGAVNAATTGDSDLASAYIVNEYAQTAKYQVEYPEDIKVFGFSFNTLWTASALLYRASIRFDKDAPLQIDDVELLLAALSPLGNDCRSDYSQFSR